MSFRLNDVAFLAAVSGPPSTLLLDLYPNAAAAYSLRQLRTGVTNVVRVRRSSDNTEQDFTATQVTNGTLTTFCGAGNGFVTTWYDQSGNGRNATQTTTANQPQIVSSGSLLTDNSKPCLQFNGSSTSLDANALASVFSGTGVFLSAATVYKTLQASPAGVVTAWGFGSSSSQNPLRLLGQQISSAAARLDERDDATVGIALNTTGGTITSQALGWINSNTTTQVLRINGTQVGTTTGANGAIALDQFSIGCLFRLTKSNFWSGNIQEIVLYQSNQTSNATAIESNINAHYAIY
jgi:hypothetical protein